VNPNINSKYTIAFAIVYPIPTLEFDEAIENLYTPAQNPVCVAISFTNICKIISGNVMNDEAKELYLYKLLKEEYQYNMLKR